MTWPGDLLSLCSGVAKPGTQSSGWVALLLIGLIMIIPFGPAEVAAVAAGALAHTGVVPFWAAVVVVAAGMLLGDILTYAVAGPTLDRARRRLTRRPHVGALLTTFEARPVWRVAGLAGLRFIPGARTPTTLMARGLQMTSTHFIFAAGAGCLLWTGLWTGGGSALADGALNLVNR